MMTYRVTALGVCLGDRSCLLGLPEGLMRVSEQQGGRACVLSRRVSGTMMLSRHCAAEECVSLAPEPPSKRLFAEPDTEPEAGGSCKPLTSSALPHVEVSKSYTDASLL